MGLESSNDSSGREFARLHARLPLRLSSSRNDQTKEQSALGTVPIDRIPGNGCPKSPGIAPSDLYRGPQTLVQTSSE